MTDTQKKEDGAQAKPATVDELVATFADLDDAGLKALHDEEAKAENPRTTLIDHIHREQESRREAALKAQAEADEAANVEADEAAKAAADEAAKAEGYADAEAKADAATAAAKKAAAKPKAASKSKAKDKSGGFDEKAVDPDGAEKLTQLALERGEAKMTLGDAKGPDLELPVKMVEIGRKRGFAINRSRVTFATEALTGRRNFTHGYVFDGGSTVKDTPLARFELAAPISAGPGEQVQFAPGALAFPA